MRRQIGLRLAPVMLALLAGSGSAQENDRAAILALIGRTFGADHSFNQAEGRAIQLAGGITSLSGRMGTER